ncbi:hypothetical protein F0562_013597 [Nyssa sinensis]|uniref:Uncharacterized protein n=1 Tax=Nyssa sinensis TaxID=561372 RepID=A0A5J4ZQJ1_9ASTE|nr:hypothetical protein F0562_013597 [Nyssa sinensis]
MTSSLKVVDERSTRGTSSSNGSGKRIVEFGKETPSHSSYCDHLLLKISNFNDLEEFAETYRSAFPEDVIVELTGKDFNGAKSNDKLHGGKY